MWFKWYKVPYALPSETFGGYEEGEQTWESWGRETKAKHPVQWFLRRTLLYFWYDVRRHTWGRIEKLLYWVKSHTYRRQHVLDLRNKTCDYRYGYVDVPEAMLYASMNLFEKFCVKENGLESLAYQASSDWLNRGDDSEEAKELAKNVQVDRMRVFEIAKDIHQWWCLGGRQCEHNEVHKLYEKVPRGARTPEGKEALKTWLDAQDALDKRDDEQLSRLLSIRGYLWT